MSRRAPVVAREGLGDVDEPRVVARDHRVAVPGHEHLEAAHVGQVDVVAVLVRDGGRLLVGALAQTHAAALGREVAAVALGAQEVRLEHGADPGEVLAQRAQRLQGAVGRRVVLHVEGDRRADAGGHLADGPGVVEGDRVAVAGDRLADGAELDAHLGGAVGREVGLGEGLEQADVGVAGRVGVGAVGDVLAEVVDGREPVRRAQLGHGVDGLGHGLAGHVAGDDRPADGRLDDGRAHEVGVRQLEHRSPEQVTGVHADRLAVDRGRQRPGGRRRGETPPASGLLAKSGALRRVRAGYGPDSARTS